MNDLKELIKEVEDAERNGQRFTCSYGDSRTAMRATNPANTGNVTARWHAAVDVAMVQCRGNKKRATAMVAKQQPHLREALIAEANGGRTPTSHAKSVGSSSASSSTGSVRKVSATAQFREEVQRLVENGMDKLSAIKLLSKRMGLSTDEPSPGFVSTRQQYR